MAEIGKRVESVAEEEVRQLQTWEGSNQKVTFQQCKAPSETKLPVEPKPSSIPKRRYR
jgi:hypothetical protein